MRVLQPGTWTMRGGCSMCGSVLEIEAGDVRYGDASRDGEGDDRFYVDCPECGTHIVLDGRRIPDGVMLQAQARH